MKKRLTLIALADSFGEGAEQRIADLDGTPVLRGTPCGQALCGAIVKVVWPIPVRPVPTCIIPTLACAAAATSSLRILSGFVADGDRWKGMVHDPRSGRTYRAFIAVREGDMLALIGCWTALCQMQS